MQTIYQFGFNGKERPPAGTVVLDCRSYMRNCFSLDAARNHPNFEHTVKVATDLLARGASIGIACHQGKHRSLAVALAVSGKLNIPITKLGGAND